MNKQEKEVVLRTENLTKKFKTEREDLLILDNINLKIHKGEITSIYGPSGSGKSTLLHILGGLMKPSSGKVFIREKDIYLSNDKELSKIRNTSIGFVFQFHHLLKEFNVIENVAFPLYIRGIKKEKAEEMAKKYLDLVGLNERLSHNVLKLSGGEKQRVAIARALIGEPDIILLDEPTGNLDFDNAQNVLDILFRLNETGTTLTIVTHNQDIVKRCEIRYSLIHGTLTNEV